MEALFRKARGCVSGNVKMASTVTMAANAVKHTKTLDQPKYWAIRPPHTGPKAGNTASAVATAEYTRPSAGP